MASKLKKAAASRKAAKQTVDVNKNYSANGFSFKALAVKPPTVARPVVL